MRVRVRLPRILLPLTALVAALAAACADAPATPTAPLRDEFVLAPGGSWTLSDGSGRVTFVGVMGDSRCPADAFCIQGGDAIVRIDVSSTARHHPYDLHTGTMAPVAHDGLVITLVEPGAVSVQRTAVHARRVPGHPAGDAAVSVVTPDGRDARGRGVAGNPPNRFERLHVALDEDAGRDAADGAARAVATEYFRDASRSIISRNDSPDIPFDVSLNPYRGCEHGCVYCYARPTHEFLGLSAGLDFETKLFVKDDAAALLRAELSRPRWTPQELVLSGVTDPYQPVERTLGITRACLEVLDEARHPVAIITKNALVTRDIDVLSSLARRGAASVALSVTTLDETLRRTMEPRTPTADVRLDAVAQLAAAGIPVGVMVAPIIPGLTDHEVPQILVKAAAAGATFAAYTIVRLPHAVKDVFATWLGTHYPDRGNKVLNQVRDVRGGGLNDPRFGHRMHGKGPVADLIRSLFTTAAARAGLGSGPPPPETRHFRRPTSQPSLFDIGA